MDEIWKPVIGYEGLYEVSNLGRVKGLERQGNWRDNILTQCMIGNYVKVSLTVNGKSQNKLVHRLVAQAFIPNPENKPEVNHKDGNKLNNCLDNLEWVTKSENIKHAYRTGLITKEVTKSRTDKMHDAVKKRVMRDDGVVFDSVADAAVSVKVSASMVSNMLHGRQNTAGGHVFKFI